MVDLSAGPWGPLRKYERWLCGRCRLCGGAEPAPASIVTREHPAPPCRSCWLRMARGRQRRPHRRDALDVESCAAPRSQGPLCACRLTPPARTLGTSGCSTVINISVRVCCSFSQVCIGRCSTSPDRYLARRRPLISRWCPCSSSVASEGLPSPHPEASDLTLRSRAPHAPLAGRRGLRSSRAPSPAQPLNRRSTATGWRCRTTTPSTWRGC